MTVLEQIIPTVSQLSSTSRWSKKPRKPERGKVIPIDWNSAEFALVTPNSSQTALSSSEVNSPIEGASYDELQLLIQRLFKIGIYSQMRRINVFQQCVETVWDWYLSGDKVGSMNPGYASSKYGKVISSFLDLAREVDAHVSAYALTTPSLIELWAIYPDNSGIEKRLSYIYGRLLESFPTEDIDFHIYSASEFKHVEDFLPKEAFHLDVGVNS